MSTALKHAIQTLFVKQETTFLTDPDADGSDYQFIKMAGDGTWQPEAEVVERPGMTGTLTRQPHVIGAKGGKLAFKMEMKASGTPAVNGVAAIASESSQVLEACFGSVFRGTGSKVVAAGSTATVVNVTTGQGGQFRKGSMVHFADSGEVRFVASVAGDAITLDRALSGGAPANDTVITNSSLFTRADRNHKSLAFVAKRDSIEYTFLGCFAKVKLSGIDAGGTALLEVEITVGTWATSTKASLPSTTTLTGINAVRAPVVKGAPFSLSGVERDISGLDFDPAQNFQFISTTQGQDNKAGFELTASAPGGSIKPYYNADHMTDFVAENNKTLAFSCGTTSNGWGLYIQAAQWKQPTFENRNGLVGETIPFACNDNGADAEYFVSQF